MEQTEGRKSKKVHEPIVDLDGEMWKPVVGFENHYLVSNLGRVKSIAYKGNKGIHHLLKQRDQNRYKLVNLTNSQGKPCSRMVHRLVYEAFIGSIPKFEHKGKGYGDEMLEINHKDENPSNNRTDNLELITRRENCNYGTRNERRTQKLINGPTSKKVYQYDISGNLVKVWPSVNECGRNGFRTQDISRCSTIHYITRGFIWSYDKLSTKDIMDILSLYNKRLEKRSAKKVYQYTQSLELVKVWDGVKECARNGYRNGCISNCCSGRCKTHKGFIWSYTNLSDNN